VSLAGTGLVLGGYPGAILLPAASGLFLVRVRGRRVPSGPWLLGGLFGGTAVIGAIGEHLIFSGDSGRLVAALSNVVPQVSCLIVIAGLVAAACQPRGPHQPGAEPRE
jgi:hypothetical protein